MQDTTVLPIWKTITKSLVESLFGKRACKMYPVQEPVFFERTRGRIEIESSKCIVCTLCAKKCPAGAIVVDKEKNTWQIDRFRCILCNACMESCKADALTMVNQYAGPVVSNQIESVPVTPPKRKKKPEAPPSATEKAEAAPPAEEKLEAPEPTEGENG
jgi:formate hydrogenlyase subunit 6/NADH:ubiquinone oxidoreductase subunit I